MKLLDYPFIESRNKTKHRKKATVDTIVLHYTAGSGDALEVARFFEKTERKVSAHFAIGRKVQSFMHDGRQWKTQVVQCVPLNWTAYHAGGGQLEGEGGINYRSIGIELCNRGWAHLGSLPSNAVMRARHRNPLSRSTKWEKYTKDQYAALRILINELKKANPDLKYITAHEDLVNPWATVSRGSKVDVGPAFKWNEIRDLCKTLGIERKRFNFETKEWDTEWKDKLLVCDSFEEDPYCPGRGDDLIVCPDDADEVERIYKSALAKKLNKG